MKATAAAMVFAPTPSDASVAVEGVESSFKAEPGFCAAARGTFDIGLAAAIGLAVSAGIPVGVAVSHEQMLDQTSLSHSGNSSLPPLTHLLLCGRWPWHAACPRGA